MEGRFHVYSVYIVHVQNYYIRHVLLQCTAAFIRIFIELLQGTQYVLTFKEYGEKNMSIVAVVGQAEYLTVSLYVI